MGPYIKRHFALKVLCYPPTYPISCLLVFLCMCCVYTKNKKCSYLKVYLQIIGYHYISYSLCTHVQHTYIYIWENPLLSTFSLKLSWIMICSWQLGCWESIQNKPCLSCCETVNINFMLIWWRIMDKQSFILQTCTSSVSDRKYHPYRLHITMLR